MIYETKNRIYTEAVTLNLCNFTEYFVRLLINTLGALYCIYEKDETKLKKISATIRDCNNLTDSIKRLSEDLKMVDDGKSKNKSKRSK